MGRLTRMQTLLCKIVIHLKVLLKQNFFTHTLLLAQSIVSNVVKIMVNFISVKS